MPLLLPRKTKQITIEAASFAIFVVVDVDGDTPRAVNH